MSEPAVIDTPPPRRPRQRRINYALAGTLVAAGLTYDQIAPRVGAAHGESLRRGLWRHGVTATRARVEPGIAMTPEPVLVRVTRQAGEILRDIYTGELERTAETLERLPIKRNLKHLRERSDVLESQVRAAKVVHQWGDTAGQGVIITGQVTDIESQVVESIPSSSVPNLDAHHNP